MRTIMARDVLGIDTISKGNDKPWENMLRYIEKEGFTQPVNFDFKNINVVQPCSSMAFIKTLSHPMFNMTLHNSAKTVENIQLMCILNNVPTTKVVNIETMNPHVETVEEKNINRIVDGLMPYFSETPNGSLFELWKKFDQIGQPKTVMYMQRAIERYTKQNELKQLDINIKDMFVQPSVVSTITDMIEEFEKHGLHCEIHSDNKDIQNKLDMSLDIGKQKYTSSERLEIMRSRLAPNRVGILTKYRDGRAKDEFGRVGRGEKVSVRVAVFKGFNKNANGEVFACFKSYNSNYLFTRSHWYLEHDGEELNDLVYDDVLIKIDDLGIYNDFIGSKYHFSNPIQYMPDGSITMYRVENNSEGHGTVVSSSYTIPERIKAVFDDFDVEYEHESLNAYIEKTREILGSEQ